MMICCLFDPKKEIVIHFVVPVVTSGEMLKQCFLLRIVLLKRQSARKYYEYNMQYKNKKKIAHFFVNFSYQNINFQLKISKKNIILFTHLSKLTYVK